MTGNTWSVQTLRPFSMAFIIHTYMQSPFLKNAVRTRSNLSTDGVVDDCSGMKEGMLDGPLKVLAWGTHSTVSL